jgi:hypothetical protein
MNVRPSDYGLMIVGVIAVVIFTTVCHDLIRSKTAMSERCVYYNGECVPLNLMRMTVKVSVLP